MNARRGFAAMDPAQQKEIARQGGQAAHRAGVAHEFSSESGQKAGAAGAARLRAKYTPEEYSRHMRELGRKGGEKLAAKFGKNYFSELGKRGRTSGHSDGASG